MITFKQDDIFNINSEALVNTVNCVGIMGRGIALQFKQKFPENFKQYEIACKHKEVVPGKMFVYSTSNIHTPKFIINFPTKRHWRDSSYIEDIEIGLISLKEVIIKNNIKSIAIPPLGCGLGGLNWNIVKEKIKLALQELSDVEITVLEPGNVPMVQNPKEPQMTAGRAALIELMQQYLSGFLDPYITLLEVHKLLYFLQECGEPLHLKYEKYIYGPYATNLRHVLNHIEGHFISGFFDGGDDPQKQLQILSGATQKAQTYLISHPETAKRIQQVGELVEGFESSFGLELLATVHWLIKKENINSLEQIIYHTHNWNEHKKQFTPRQIEIAVIRLLKKGWIKDIKGIIYQ